MKRTLTFVGLTLCLLGSVADAQQGGGVPAAQYVPGHPWTSIIPDPDRYDWDATNTRPGYQYRGLLPMQQRFYDYIQTKRRNNEPLSWAEQSMIRWLTSARRWPEPPRPNEFWAAYMRYLRGLKNDNLNVAQNIMLSELMARGFVVMDMVPNRDSQRIRNYLTSGPFRERNWFERTFGRAEPWMDNLMAGWGYDLRPSSGGGGNAFPTGEPFNGLKVTYNISGATLAQPEDAEGFTIRRSLKGVLGTGTLAISGTVSVGGFGADISLSVWAGDKKAEKKFYLENTGSKGTSTNYSLSVPIPAEARTGGFAMKLDGRYSMGGGHRGCYVYGTLGPSQAQLNADAAAAEAKWRKEVEDTLARLGYQNTPEGKEVEAMRQALAGGDAGWKAFVDKRLKELGYDDSPQAAQYEELEHAMFKGGAIWDKYMKDHSTGGASGGQVANPDGGGVSTPVTVAPTGGTTTGGPTGTPSDVGGLQVGTAAEGGQVANAANTFTAPPQISCALNFTALPANTTILASWVRDGREVIRSERQAGGTGWVSFSLLSGGTAPLAPGTYTVTITAAGKVLGRKTFVVKAGGQG